MTEGKGNTGNYALKVLGPVAIMVAIIWVGFSLIREYVPEYPEGHVHDPPEVGETVPDFELTLLGSDQKIKLSSLNFKGVLINFWATWCEPCVYEMPSIIELYDELKDDGFMVVFINVDDDPNQSAPEVIEKLALPFPTYRDVDEKLSNIFDVHALPLTVILNNSREVLFVQPGERDWSTPGVIKQVRGWLAK